MHKQIYKNAQECQGMLQWSSYISKMSSNFENLTDRDVHEAGTYIRTTAGKLIPHSQGLS
jgi:hypothetical protein